ncbi:hypothetical protein GOP47_0014073 [Adiantum capillus-veneris]|uniref:D-isomer specific 2-hydroxyacid dehydrogenase catalytic domain-containing protein n=1 Tax=Adiantum capillus-veneris TaxID=13818 RepID=A0A9D4UQ68_ADICA|nr:hypothetical protein GOP47_0014073 [Adiantum capillus-veneris]
MVLPSTTARVAGCNRRWLWRRAAEKAAAAYCSRSTQQFCSSTMEAPEHSHPLTRVLFCGLQFPSSFSYTKQCLLPHPYVQVDALAHEEVPLRIEDYDLCVVRMMRFDSSVIARAKKLKLLMQFGVGLEGVDIEAATKAGIKVARIPGDTSGNALSCAEHAIYLILALLRDQKGMDRSVQQMKIGFPTGQTLFGFHSGVWKYW